MATSIGEGASIGRWASFTKSPLYIIGTKHILCESMPCFIKIGCHEKPISWWQEHYKGIWKKEGYTVAEIEEYGQYTDLLAKRTKWQR